jgi:RNA polymerase-binding transcription factor DksA
MDKKTIKKLQKRLLEKKKGLEHQLSELAVKDKNLKGDYDARFKDFGDEIFDNSAEAAEVSEYQANLSLEANLEVQLRDVNMALEKIRKGTFGKCESCGKEISKDRLKALPQARLCLSCSKSKQ